MELLQLKYFAHAAKTENFSHTAQFFRVPPSTVSLTVKRLEEELGVPLFNRNKNRISLNENGKRFEKEISAALSHINAALGVLSESVDRGKIRLLVLSDRRIVTEKISEFKTQNPNITFLIEHSISTDYRNFDLIISEESPNFSGFIKTSYINENILLALAKSNPLAQNREIFLKDLQNEPFITMPDGASLYRITSLACQSAAFEPNIVIKCDDPYYLRKYINMNLGITLVPEISWEGQFGSNTVLRKISDFSYIRKTFIYENPRQINPPSSQFKEFLLK